MFLLLTYPLSCCYLNFLLQSTTECCRYYLKSATNWCWSLNFSKDSLYCSINIKLTIVPKLWMIFCWIPLKLMKTNDTTFNRSSYHNRVCTLLFSLGLIPIPNKLNSNPSVSPRFMSLSHWNIKRRLNWKWVIQGTLVKQKNYIHMIYIHIHICA